MARRFSLLLSPAGILTGYLLALFAATAGVVSIPFSSISFGLLFVVVSVFFVVAIPVIVRAYLLMTIGFARAIIDLGGRLFLGTDQTTGWQNRVKPCNFQKNSGATDNRQRAAGCGTGGSTGLCEMTKDR
jgi:hypothetical protein